MQTANPDVAAVRAVICILHEQFRPNPDDLVDSLSLFLRLLNNIEPRFEEQDALMQKHFAACLPAS
jgi:hypothetical protein